MIALAYFVEANLTLVASVVVLAVLRLLVTALGGPRSPRTDVLALRASLAISSVIPVFSVALKSASGIDTVLLGMTTEFDTILGTAVIWARGAQSSGILLPVLLIGSVVTGLSMIYLDLRALSRLKSASRVISRMGRVVLREGQPGTHPCAFLERRTLTVLLPSGTCIRDRRTILYHEAAHVRHRDLHWNWILSLAAILYAWNPAFWLLSMLHRHQCEASSDRRVVSRRPVSLQEYVETLLGVAGTSSVAPKPAGSMFLGARRLQKAGLKRRILSLLNSTDDGLEKPLFPVFLAMALLTGMALATIKIDVQPWSVATLINATNENLERMTFNKPARAFGLVLAY